MFPSTETGIIQLNPQTFAFTSGSDQLGNKGRDPDERSLWSTFESEVCIRLEKVGECEERPKGTPVEFWTGQIESPSPHDGPTFQNGQVITRKVGRGHIATKDPVLASLTQASKGFYGRPLCFAR